MTKSYLQFTEIFSGLSPYELNHLCEVMLCKIEESAAGHHHKKIRGMITEQDLQFALTRTMRDIALILREQDIQEQKAHMFTMDKIAA